MDSPDKKKKEASPGTPTLALNETDAAFALGLKPRTLQNWRWEGEGPPYVRVSSRCVRYLVSDLEKWAAGKAQASTSSNT